MGLSHQSARTILLGTVLLTSAVSVLTGTILIQYFSVDVLSSLLYVPQDCWFDWGTNVGRHCFSDYGWQAFAALRPNPWEHFGPPYWPNNPYPPSAMAPFLFFGLIGKWAHYPLVGLTLYLLCLLIAVLSPAFWAARGARGLERIVVFFALGVLAIPAWAAVDRGNSTGFFAPIALVFLISLRRRRWGVVTLMVILAALLKPQLVLLAVALFAARQWRMGGLAIGGAAIFNLAAYSLWPADFPQTIPQSIHNVIGYSSPSDEVSYANVAFGRVLLWIPDAIKVIESGNKLPEGYLASTRALIGYGVVALVVAAISVLGRRIPPVMVGIALLTTASLFPAVTYRYYLVFALAIGALLVRDPEGPPGSGIFSGLGDQRRAVGICVSLATALSIAQIAVPGPPIPVAIATQPGVLAVVRTSPVVMTTALLASLLWLIACGVIIVSYARNPARDPAEDASARSETHEPTPVASI